MEDQLIRLPSVRFAEEEPAIERERMALQCMALVTHLQTITQKNIGQTTLDLTTFVMGDPSDSRDLVTRRFNVASLLVNRFPEMEPKALKDLTALISTGVIESWPAGGR